MKVKELIAELTQYDPNAELEIKITNIVETFELNSVDIHPLFCKGKSNLSEDKTKVICAYYVTLRGGLK